MGDSEMVSRSSEARRSSRRFAQHAILQQPVKAFLGVNVVPPAIAAQIAQTILRGANNPSSQSTGNWICDDGFNDTATYRQTEMCKYVAHVERIIGEPDVMDIVPFETFDEYTNSSLMLFFLLTGAPPAASGTVPLTSLMCTRPQPTTVKSPSDTSYFNRWYATMNIANLSCADHSPALPPASCNSAGDCQLYADFLGHPVTCTNGRCDNLTTCSDGSECMPWENCTATGCVNIGACSDSDPFSVTNCPVGTYCNNGECLRL